ncbi:MAG: PaaI family thioesterase [Polyangiaceae bacterium]|nr:PaaI family thioesterase [Polyangiaceae bacterium]
MTDYRYGVVSPDEVKALTGKEVLEAVISGQLPQALISKQNSFWIVEVGEGTAVFEGEPGPELCNPVGAIHGGWALTLIDSAAACACHSLLPAGVGYTTIETKGNFSRPIRPNTGRVRCEGRVVSQGRQICSAQACLTDSSGNVLAHGTSTLMILDYLRQTSGRSET